METFWFFRLRFRRAYDTAHDSDFRFSLGHKLSYDSDYDSDSVAGDLLTCFATVPGEVNIERERFKMKLLSNYVDSAEL